MMMVLNIFLGFWLLAIGYWQKLKANGQQLTAIFTLRREFPFQQQVLHLQREPQ